jgi:hypothetical protein
VAVSNNFNRYKITPKPFSFLVTGEVVKYQTREIAARPSWPDRQGISSGITKAEHKNPCLPTGKFYNLFLAI